MDILLRNRNGQTTVVSFHVNLYLLGGVYPTLGNLVKFPSDGYGIISGVTLAFARAIGEYGATSMLAGNIAGKTSTISQQIAMVIQSGDYATAGFWCIVIIAISFACLVSINMICGKSKGIKRKRKNNVAHSKNKKKVG